MSPRPPRMGHRLLPRSGCHLSPSPECPFLHAPESKQVACPVAGCESGEKDSFSLNGEEVAKQPGEALADLRQRGRKESCTVDWSWHSEDSQVLSLEALGLGILDTRDGWAQYIARHTGRN